MVSPFGGLVSTVNMAPAEYVAQRTWSTFGRGKQLRARFDEESLVDLVASVRRLRQCLGGRAACAERSLGIFALEALGVPVQPPHGTLPGCSLRKIRGVQSRCGVTSCSIAYRLLPRRESASTRSPPTAQPTRCSYFAGSQLRVPIATKEAGKNGVPTFRGSNPLNVVLL